ncbi:Gfo/Idh/MocA family protein [Halosolutus gelatinilyticus]|uniref:Gfo/Idh/MocA family protein n=1 Tax=Halosolutus gelatinilyticus TaxID=2931975 RepID=UPI001FF33B10|nr:Gfo/Idh/MocA family oxidoreductase [Halosolutus gelatinilyticus]
MTHERIDVGVIGVGTMGQHHARVYNEIPGANLVGVSDLDEARARDVASKYDTEALDRDALLAAADAVSVVVPTRCHYEMIATCLDADVATLVEKPVIEDLSRADELRSRVASAEVPVQVGHIERFNPAVSELERIIRDLSIVSLRAQRLGPPITRELGDNIVYDLMIHDIDVLLSLIRSEPVEIAATGVRGNRHSSALVEFDNGVMASLTASRKTQRKVRTLEITAEECFIELDYLDKSIEIYRNSVPEYIERNGDVRFKHESIIERPTVPNVEPLRRELESFLEVTATNGTPDVSVQDGLNALSVALEIEAKTAESATSELANLGDD